MEIADLWALGFLVVCLILSAFFSSSETAFIALSRPRLLHLVSIGRPRAQLVSSLVQRPERLLSTVLLGNNLVNTGAAAVGTALAIKFISNDSLAVVISTLGVTGLILIFSEALPKTVAWNRSENLAFAVARPLKLVEWLLSPAVRLLQGITLAFTRLLGVTSQRSYVSEEEIRTMIAAGAQTGEMEASEAALLEKVFRFGDQQIREIMTPRTAIVWVEMGLTLNEFLKLYAQHSHTRFPVFEGSMENVVGVLSNKDVVVAMGKDEIKEGDSVTNLLRPAYFVPETKTISSTFTDMQQGSYGLVLTVDEFGGIAGLATLKQLLEVLVGEVREEDSASDDSYKEVDENTFHLDAGVGISEVNEKLGLNIPEGDYQTVAGFILERLGRIPVEGDGLEYRDLLLTVKMMQGVKIQEVELKRTEVAAKGNEASR
jgi:putative hemolysin